MHPSHRTFVTAAVRPLLVAAVLAGCNGEAVPTDDTDAPGPSSEAVWSSIAVDAVEGMDAQVVDVRSPTEFAAGHIPGALNLFSDELRRNVGGVPGQALPRNAADSLLDAAGLTADRPIIVYGAENDTQTARAFWSLALYGAEADLLLVDGGLEAWVDAGLATESGASDAAATTWNGVDTREELRVDLEWMLAHHTDADVQVFDVRSSSEYADGHVPGAINVPWTENLRPNGLFKSVTNVLELHGDPQVSTVVVYCQSGARASVSWAILKIAGIEDVRLYDGSWNEWGTDPDTPKVTGSSPN